MTEDWFLSAGRKSYVMRIYVLDHPEKFSSEPKASRQEHLLEKRNYLVITGSIKYWNKFWIRFQFNFSK